MGELYDAPKRPFQEGACNKLALLGAGQLMLGGMRQSDGFTAFPPRDCS